ncbi:Uncharacterized protein HZ326_8112 [Fusarium oxysporum f. sp. albedinis]|nr:Uncharacterized protein HZ326_8112 [Fusarium oxysporum f. sp. albedinis]
MRKLHHGPGLTPGKKENQIVASVEEDEYYEHKILTCSAAHSPTFFLQPTRKASTSSVEHSQFPFKHTSSHSSTDIGS